MKNPWEWDEDYLLGLVAAKTKESIELDFKDSASLQNTDKKKEEISKDVSAFANSAGGTLLYGMKEDPQTHVALGLDKGSDPTDITKEWLEQVINSNIHRRIEGIRIHQIELTSTSPGRIAYVVYVPQSRRTPHQAANKKYYKRYNFQSIPMEEYEVRDLYLRGHTPDLRMTFSLDSVKPVISHYGFETEPFSLIPAIANDAAEPAEYAVIKMFIDQGLTVVSAEDFKVRNGLTLTIGQNPRQVTVVSMNWAIPGKLPIFDLPFTLADEPIKLKAKMNQQDKPKVYLLGYEIRSPRMPMKQAFGFLVITPEKIGFLFNGVFFTADEVILKLRELGM